MRSCFNPRLFKRASAGIPIAIAFGALVSIYFLPAAAWACACGCSVFDVGSTSLLPKEGDHGGVVYFEWDHANQKINWSGLSKAPAANNGDKNILTDWYVLGLNYMFSREWGVTVRAPSANRSFLTDVNFPDTPADLQRFHVSTLGDIEIMGMYTGFSKDMSTGVMFGLKLPTGNYTAPGFDRDTQIGTGSTDLLLGGFHRGMITGDNAWQYFGQVKLTTPLLTSSAFDEDLGRSADYRPGTQIDGAFGIVYNNLYKAGPFDKVAPLLQIIVSHRQPDGGAAAFPENTGYDRIFISPGFDITKVVDDPKNQTVKLYGDVEIPVYQRANGNQIVAPYLLKIVAAYTF
ncbi:MAG TPA: hypothetical protein VE986_03660 [Hyphomicrobiales bacterium]|nr:hypothetical protein [Hyphomicrobiales bacterium]